MSKCEHNDHTHGMLWLAVVLTMIGACNECNGDYRKLQRDNDDLRHRVEQLEQRPR